MYQCLLFEDVLCPCLSYLLICIVVVDHDVNIAAKQCFSYSNALIYLSTTSQPVSQAT